MDLKALREQAIMEANDEFAEQKVENYKDIVRQIIWKISANNESISKLQAVNDLLKKELSDLELKEFNRVTI